MSDAQKHRQIQATVLVDGRWINDTECHQFVTYQAQSTPPTDPNVNKVAMTLDGDVNLGRFPPGGGFAKQTDIVLTLGTCNFTDSSGTPMVLDFPTDGSAITFPEYENPPFEGLQPFTNVQQSSNRISFTDADVQKGVYSYQLRVRCQYVNQNPPGTWYIDLDPKVVNPG